jgi:hypothetical protein
MAINFTTGTINQPDAGSVGQAMAEKIRDDVVAHAAWDLVEEFTPSGGAYRYYIFKCLAASSELTSDFYIGISRRLSDGALYIFMGEEYNAGSHTLKYYAPTNYYNNGQVFDEFGRIPATEFILGPAGLTNLAGQPHYYYWVPNSTSTKWWINVYDDGFAVAFSGTANGWWFCGAFTPMCDLPIDMPLFLAGNQGSNISSHGYMTRNPAAAGITYTGSALFAAGDLFLGFPGDFRYNDKLQSNQRTVAEIGMRVYENNTGDRAIYGSAIGKIRHMRSGNGQLPAGLSFGDAYVLDGRLWVPPAPTDARVWDTGVASS